MTQPFRIVPRLPASAVKTYQLLAPVRTHFRPAMCADVDCAAYLRGWETRVDESTDLGARQAHYIRREARRRYVETRERSGLTVFVFEAGQSCFRQHRSALERQPLYVVRDGDWRGNPRGTEPRIHDRPDDWVDDFATHQGRIVDTLNQG